MHPHLFDIYYCLPGPGRSLAATLHGFRLQRWRYGPETEKLVSEALERERWSPDDWKVWQEKRLAHVLRRAVEQVPYYRNYWARQGGVGDAWKDLNEWPVLNKNAIREDPLAFLADDCHRNRMYEEHTGGTTGTPLRLWWSRRTVREWYALFEARWRQWYGVTRFDRWANVGGQLVTRVGRKRPPYWVWNGALRQLYMSSFHLSPDRISHYLDALVAHRIKYLFGYTSSLSFLAQEALRLGWQERKFQVALTNAEGVLAYQRDAIQRAFGCPVRETYGMAEIVVAASECADGRLHLWPEVGAVEILEGNAPAAPGVPGDLVCTGLLNADMPLIRYRVGDRVCLPAEDTICSCGCRLPTLEYVEGRLDEVLYARDGRRLPQLSAVFNTDLPIRAGQIVQERLDQILLRIVAAPGFTDQTSQRLIDRLRDRMGPVDVIVQCVDELPRSKRGKIQAVLCRLPNDQLEQLTGAPSGITT